jgi:C4-dicarboxylate-specific signal transduction histidine kinase
MPEKFSEEQYSKLSEKGKQKVDELLTRARTLREEIKRQEEFAKKFSISPDAESNLMQKQQEIALDYNKKDLEEIEQRLKSIYGITEY